MRRKRAVRIRYVVQQTREERLADVADAYARKMEKIRPAMEAILPIVEFAFAGEFEKAVAAHASAVGVARDAHELAGQLITRLERECARSSALETALTRSVELNKEVIAIARRALAALEHVKRSPHSHQARSDAGH